MWSSPEDCIGVAARLGFFPMRRCGGRGLGARQNVLFRNGAILFREKATKAASVTQKSSKMSALQKAVQQVQSNYGKGSLMNLGDSSIAEGVEVISTGSLGLDLALGVGGIPKGRIIEVYGPEASGKTTVALHIIAEAQKAGGTCCFIDAEHALDATYARKLGVDTSSLLLSQPDSGEQALDITDTLVRSSAVDLVVIDSVAALTPRYRTSA